MRKGQLHIMIIIINRTILFDNHSSPAALPKLAMAQSGQIGVVNYTVGNAIEVTFVTPDYGRPTLDLLDDRGNTVLHFNPRWDEHALVLNTKCGSWGQEERPQGFDFSSRVPISVRVEAAHDALVILVNGRIIHRYRHRIDMGQIKKAHFHVINPSGTPARLISLAQFF